MPQWMPEGNQVLPSSDDMRTTAKWAQLVYNSTGPKPSPFPEGCAPQPGDDEQRLEQKINAMMQ